MLRGFEHLSRDAKAERSGTVQKKEKTRGNHTDVYEYLKGGRKEEKYTLLSVAQCQSRKQWTQIETWEVPPEHKETFFFL